MLKFTNYKLKYTPDQYTNNNKNNKGLYMQPQTHTACTSYYNEAQSLLYHSATPK
jgi:hypothetical protein